MRAPALSSIVRGSPRGDPGRTLLLGTVGTFALNAGAVVLNFVLVLLLSRLLGAAGYGAYASAFAWAGVLSIVAVLGLAPLVVRHVASYHASESWGLVRGLLRRANQTVTAASVATVVLAAPAGWMIYRGRSELMHPFWVALLLVPLIALSSLRQAAMQGLGRVVLGRTPDTVVAPALFIAATLTAGIALDDRFTATWATALQVGTTTCALALGAWLLRRSLPHSVLLAVPEYEMRSWRRSGIPLVLLNVVMAANAQVGTIMLGALATAADAGVFNVAVRTTSLISFVMLAASYPLMPLVARLHASGERERLQRTVIRTARGVLLISAPTGFVLVLFAPLILRLFGAEFGDGATAMRILAVGEVVNVLTGFGGLVLVMSGREADLAWSVAVGAAVNLGLSAALIPVLDVKGAAIAAATAMAFSNTIMSLLAWRRLRVWTLVTGPGRSRTS